MLHVNFVHGWGFSSAIWEDLITSLRAQYPDIVFNTLDCGFLNPEKAIGFDSVFQHIPDKPTLWIGHSLGVMLILRYAPRIDGLLSIAGFQQFCPLVPLQIVTKMRQSLAKNAQAQMRGFYQANGIHDEIPLLLNIPQLDFGLRYLQEKSGHLNRQQPYPIRAMRLFGCAVTWPIPK